MLDDLNSKFGGGSMEFNIQDAEEAKTPGIQSNSYGILALPKVMQSDPAIKKDTFSSPHQMEQIQEEVGYARSSELVQLRRERPSSNRRRRVITIRDL